MRLCLIGIGYVLLEIIDELLVLSLIDSLVASRILWEHLFEQGSLTDHFY